MLFNSYAFIFFFLPLAVLGYYLTSLISIKPLYNLFFLTLISLIFYSYWDVRFLPIISCSIISNYLLSLLIGSQSLDVKIRKAVLIFAIMCNICSLFFYKYFNFGIEIINLLPSVNINPPFSLVLPLGISFFTFTQIAYLSDLYLGFVKERHFIKYVLFVTYFPHLISGPILSHKEMMPQFDIEKKSHLIFENIALGTTIFILGLFKKVIIADGLALIADPIFKAVSLGEISQLDALGGALAYSLQIYFDFSGYSEMAIGISYMFGILLPFNFDSPYKARSIIDFWRRWHISLSRFLREYIYIPLGGNRGSFKRYRNIFITMLIGGIWHGAGWTYVAWGALHATFLVINHGWRSLQNFYPGIHQCIKSRYYMIGSLVVTQSIVIIGWIYFRSDTITTAHTFLRSLFGFHTSVTPYVSSITTVELLVIVSLYYICITFPNLKAMFAKWHIGLSAYENHFLWSITTLEWKLSKTYAAIISGAMLVVLLVILMVGDGTKFLYFQF